MTTKTQIQDTINMIGEELIGELIDHICEVNFLDIEEATDLIYETEMGELLETMVTNRNLKNRIQAVI